MLDIWLIGDTVFTLYSHLLLFTLYMYYSSTRQFYYPSTKHTYIILTPLLRKHANSNILKILPTKNEIIQIKILILFHISAQNIDCGYSLEPPRRVPTIYVFEQKQDK